MGVDSWSLGRRVASHDGTLVRNDRGASTNYNKRFETELRDCSRVGMLFGRDRCPYGRDGALVKVRLRVEARCKVRGQEMTIAKSVSVVGFSS